MSQKSDSSKISMKTPHSLERKSPSKISVQKSISPSPIPSKSKTPSILPIELKSKDTPIVTKVSEKPTQTNKDLTIDSGNISSIDSDGSLGEFVLSEDDYVEGDVGDDNKDDEEEYDKDEDGDDEEEDGEEEEDEDEQEERFLKKTKKLVANISSDISSDISSSPENTLQSVNRGGSKLKTDIKNYKLTGNKHYFRQRLRSRQKDLFLERKQGKFSSYTRSCPWQFRKMPVILTDEEKAYIDSRR